MNHLHLIKVKYLPATSYKGTRVKLTSTRHNESKIIPFDYKFDNALEVAKDYLKNDLKYTIKATCNIDCSDCIYGVLVKQFSEFVPTELKGKINTVFDDKGNRLY